MLSALADAASGLVPNRGWFIFGGYNKQFVDNAKTSDCGRQLVSRTKSVSEHTGLLQLCSAGQF
jgi:hypothetical protein